MIGSHEKRMSSEKLSRSTKQLKSEGPIREKFRTSLNLMEQDRHFLLESLREVQKKYELEADKNFELGRNLDYQSEHIKNLEHDRENLADSVKSLQRQLGELEDHYSGLLQERSALQVSMAQLQEELQINRMQAADKEVYIDQLTSSYHDEKETILGVHNKHSRLLTSKLLTDALARLVGNLKSWAFFGIKAKIAQKAAIGRLGFRFLVKVVKNRMEFGLRSLSANVREEKIESILTNFVEKRRKMRIKKNVFEGVKFSAAELRNVQKKVRKGVEKMWIVDQIRVKVRVLRFLHQWKNVKVKDLYGKRVLWGLIMKKYSRGLEIYLHYWAKVSKIYKQLQANEDLAIDLSAFSIKQGVFYEFKRVAQLSAEKRKFTFFVTRLQTHKNKYKVLKVFKAYKSLQRLKKNRLFHLCLHFSNKSVKAFYIKWQSRISSSKQISSFSKVLKTQKKKMMNSEARNLFLAWKIFVSNNKRVKMIKTLNTEIPKREGYEKAYSELLSYNQEMLIVKSLKSMMRSGNNLVRSYFFTWQSAVYSFHQGTKNIGKKFSHLYNATLKQAFDNWKEFKHMHDIIAVAQDNNEARRENEVLLEHITNLDNCLKATTEAKNVVSILNLLKCVKNIYRKTKINNLRKWAQNAFKASNCLSGAQHLTSVLYFTLLRDSFLSLQLFNDNKTRKSIRQRKLYTFTFKKYKRINATLLESWLNYVRLSKYHRNKISKIVVKRYRQSAQFAFETWKLWLETLLVNERDVQYEVLDNDFNQVREELEEVCNCLSIEKDQTWRLQDHIKYKKLKRYILTLISLGSATTSAALFRWKSFTRKTRLRSKYLKKMVNYNLKLDLKRAMRIWEFFKTCKNKAANNSNINNLIIEKKSLRRDMNAMKTSLETVIYQKEAMIQEHILNSQQLLARVEKFVEISSRRQNETVQLPKSHVFFQQWKAEYLDKKSKIAQLLKITRKSRLRKGLQAVSAFALQVTRQQTINVQICKFILSFRSRKLKHSFHTWLQNSFLSVKGDQSKEIRIFNNKLNALGIRYKSSKQNSLNKAVKFVNGKKKQMVVTGWSKVARKMRRVREAGMEFEGLAENMKARYGFDGWIEFARYRLRNKEFEIVMMRSRLKKLLNLTFESWRNSHFVGKTVEIALKKTSFHSCRDFKFFAFACIKSFVSSKTTHKTWLDYSKQQLLKTSFILCTKKQICQTFIHWHNKTCFISTLLRKIQKILISTQTRITQKSFKTWTFKTTLLKTIDAVENFGISAQHVKKLQTVMATLQKFIRKEGLTSRYLDEYLMQLLPAEYFLSFKAVDKRDRLHFRFVLWKIFVLKRQKIRSASFRMSVFRHKPLLLQKFLCWKRICPNFSVALRRLTRDSLMRTLALLDTDLRNLKASLKDKHVSLKYMESYVEILEEHVRRGQNQALANCAAGVKKTLMTCLFRWFFNTQTCQIVEHDFHIRDLEEELMYVRRKCKDFDVENKELVIENKGLINALMKAENLIMKTHR